MLLMLRHNVPALLLAGFGGDVELYKQLRLMSDVIMLPFREKLRIRTFVCGRRAAYLLEGGNEKAVCSFSVSVSSPFLSLWNIRLRRRAASSHRPSTSSWPPCWRLWSLWGHSQGSRPGVTARGHSQGSQGRTGGRRGV